MHELQISQLLQQLDSGKLDCAILELVKESEAFMFMKVPLFDEPVQWHLCRSYLGKLRSNADVGFCR